MRQPAHSDFAKLLLGCGVDYRIEILGRAAHTDARVSRLASEIAETHAPGLTALYLCDVYTIRSAGEISRETLRELLLDPVTQEMTVAAPADLELHRDADALIEIAYKPGVTDPVATTLRSALERLAPESIGPSTEVATAKQYRLVADPVPSRAALERIAFMRHNPLIERVALSRREPRRSDQAEHGEQNLPLTYDTHLPASPAGIETFDVAEASPRELSELSERRLLALTPAELTAIRDYYADPAVQAARAAAGLGRAATDCELEMIAQTWSEHCKHKIFRARIDYDDGTGTRHIDGLFDTYIRRTTEEIARNREDLRSVFHDNSGVIDFDDEWVLCFKAETHNSPSALDPYGGAITGIVGVNRDIIGTGKGARPIFNTDVLCFGRLDTPPRELPTGFLHPETILRGVHSGIVDGGNQSGIPTVAGAVLFDESYAGKPLVFCGTGGIMPREVRGEPSWVNHVDPGDKAVMVGGRIGKDGIHGATFSSLALDESSPTSAVQIGDPITQRRMLDFLLEARDQGLFRGITDNGAGGLSSSLGEMAQLAGGLRLDLGRCPLKYPGLAPWEILVSESQERMSLAVAPEMVNRFLALAADRDVEATVVGEFTDSGYVALFHGADPVGQLSLSFLHDGVPKMQLRARWEPPEARRTARAPEPEWDTQDALTESLMALLADHTIASKEYLVRQYDHEVQARTVGKPFCGRRGRGPGDGAVLTPRYDSARGVTVTHGICPRYSDWDTYTMAMCAVDEAMRAHVALGGDPDQAAALDNFCWPDPIASAETRDGEYKLAQLVRACEGLAEACRAYGLPLISGKDSMKNDARMGGTKVSVRPTLLISLTGIVPDVHRFPESAFRRPGDLVYLLGETDGALAGSRYEAHLGEPLDGAPRPRLEEAVRRYRALFAAVSAGHVSSVHDLSDGGLAVCLAECAIGGELGCELDLTELMEDPQREDQQPGRNRLDQPGRNTLNQPGPDSAQRPDLAARPSRRLTPHELLFSESPGRFVVSLSPDRASAFEEEMRGTPVYRLGEVTERPQLRLRAGGSELIDCELFRLDEAWQSLNRALAGPTTRWRGGNEVRPRSHHEVEGDL
jgi:phosphoribosylformylglycinamidine synthase